MTIFSIIGTDVLGPCYENATTRAEDLGETIAPSNYLKSDINYYKYVIPQLWKTYQRNPDFKHDIDLIFGKQK